MKKLFSCGALAAVFLTGASPVSAGELTLTITNGRVTLVAQEVTVRQILAEWARVGQTKIVNGEKLMGPPLTIELRDVPESKALETLLRSAAGYVIAPRPVGRTGPSAYDAVVILATSRAPVATASAPPTFRPPAQPVVPQMNDDPNDGNSEPQAVVPGSQGQPFQGQPNRPGIPTQNTPQGPLTSPVPGQLPPPPAATPGNPYQPQPGARPAPGVPGAARPGGGGTGGGPGGGPGGGQ